MLRAEKAVTTRSLAAAPTPPLSPRSASSAQMRPASAAESGYSTKNPLPASPITWGLPPTAVATHGRAMAIASSNALDIPSLSDGSTKTSSVPRTRGMSVRLPSSTTASRMPSSSANARGSGSHSPTPAIHRPFEEAEWFNAIGWPFQHWQSSRYSDGSFGAWYGADSVEATVYETAYHWYHGLLADAEGYFRRAVAQDATQWRF